MQKLLTEILDLLFPPRPTEAILQQTKIEIVHKLYEPNLFASVIYLSRYQDSVIQASIIENKFHHHKFATKLLGEILQKWVQTQTKKTLYIPIPLGTKRRKVRGHNQAESILKQLQPGISIYTNLLQRNIETLPQTQLNKTERLKNIKNAFVWNNVKIDWSLYEQVVIVDDVVTTGATLLAAKSTLTSTIPNNIKIITLAISH